MAGLHEANAFVRTSDGFTTHIRREGLPQQINLCRPCSAQRLQPHTHSTGWSSSHLQHHTSSHFLHGSLLNSPCLFRAITTAMGSTVELRADGNNAILTKVDKLRELVGARVSLPQVRQRQFVEETYSHDFNALFISWLSPVISLLAKAPSLRV